MSGRVTLDEYKEFFARGGKIKICPSGPGCSDTRPVLLKRWAEPGVVYGTVDGTPWSKIV